MIRTDPETMVIKSMIADSGIATLTLARADKRNALTSAMYTEMADFMTATATNASVRVLVIAAEGQDFCAGNDLADFLSTPPESVDAPVFRFMAAMVAFPKPILVAVKGNCVGIGATLLLHADMVIADATARLIFPFVPMGLVPEFGASLLLPQRVGRAIAHEMLLLGTPVDAARALRLGLVNEIVESLQHATEAVATRLAALPPQAVQAARKLLKGDGQALAVCMRDEAAAFRTALQSPEAKEFIQGFLAKNRSASSA